jgi:predicted DNA-binding protein
MNTKATSLRLSEDQAAELAAVCRADGVKMSEAVREAIDKHIAERREDQEFKERLRKRMEEDREVLERLTE